MAAISPAVPAPVAPATCIADIITGYLGDAPEGEEVDVIFKKRILLRLFSQATEPCLDWKQRLEDMREAIDGCFLPFNEKAMSAWYINGGPTYRLCEINECELLKRIILQAPPTQKEFYFCDVGAGNFQLGETIANFMNRQDDLPEGITIHIIGTRAEAAPEENIVISGRCRQVKLGCFKVEEFHSELDRCGLDVKGKLDMVVSRLCLMHLADPLGTYAQIHDAVRPGSGILSMDNFDYPLKDEWEPTQHGIRQSTYLMIQLLLDTGSPFLARVYSDEHCGSFILKRRDNTPCSLPIHYQPCRNHSNPYRREPIGENPWRISLPVPYNAIYGSKPLFDSLRAHGLIDKFHTWRPIEALPAGRKR